MTQIYRYFKFTDFIFCKFALKFIFTAFRYTHDDDDDELLTYLPGLARQDQKLTPVQLVSQVPLYDAATISKAGHTTNAKPIIWRRLPAPEQLKEVVATCFFLIVVF